MFGVWLRNSTYKEHIPVSVLLERAYRLMEPTQKVPGFYATSLKVVGSRPDEANRFL
jgi:hypothetical protein